MLPAPRPPVQIAGLTGASEISVGLWVACAIVANGQVMCWGKNTDGQLGNGIPMGSISPIPVPVAGLTAATHISVGTYSTCAVLANGTVQCWGANEYGELGDGTYTTSQIPRTVVGLANATAVAVGDWHACALVGGGAIYCWGNNMDGQRGNGTSSQQGAPGQSQPGLPVVGVAGARALAAFDSGSAALLANGTVATWGVSAQGQQGNGTYGPPPPNQFSTVPVAANVTGAVALSARQTTICAIVPSGVTCWGSQFPGGLNTTPIPTLLPGTGNARGPYSGFPLFRLCRTSKRSGRVLGHQYLRPAGRRNDQRLCDTCAGGPLMGIFEQTRSTDSRK
jgi:alpha-tubulin suppressor-like RCC1 family protein